MDLKVNRLASSFRPTELPLPTYQTTGAAGADLYAALEGPVSLSPGERVLVPTGIALELPIGFGSTGQTTFGTRVKTRGDHAQCTGHYRFGL